MIAVCGHSAADPLRTLGGLLLYRWMRSLAFMVALAAAPSQSASSDYDEKQYINDVADIPGLYVPLITTALKRPEMRGRPLDCYRVRVTRWEGVWRVSFSGYREPMPPDTETEIHVGHMPQNARCPDISFEFDKKGKVNRRILSRE